MLTPQQQEAFRARLPEIVQSGINDADSATEAAELLIRLAVRHMQFFWGSPDEPDRVRSICKEFVDKAADEIK